MASTPLASAGAEGVPRDETRCCEDCGDAAAELAQTADGYTVCECCWHFRGQAAEVAEADVGEQDDDFALYDYEFEEEEEVVGSTEWWSNAIEETKDTGAYSLLMSSGAHW